MGDIPSGDFATWASAVVACGSLIVSVVALVKSNRAQHDANAAQRRIVEIEEQRERARISRELQARLRTELRKVRARIYRLYLINDGAAEARNVRVEIDGKPLEDHPACLRRNSMPSLIGPRNEASYNLSLQQGCLPPFNVKVTWDDDSGEGRSYRTTVTW